MTDQLASFFASPLAMGYAAGAAAAGSLAFWVAKRSARSQASALLKVSATALAVTLLVAACVAFYASYRLTLLQYYVDIKKAAA